MKKRLYFILLAILFTTVCIDPMTKASAKENNQAFTIMAEIKEYVVTKNWDAAEQYAEKLDRYYDDNKWKFQFMADKDEYTEANSLIKQLNASIQTKERGQTLILLAHLQSIFQEIYRM